MKKTIFSLSLVLIVCGFAQAQPDAIFQHLPPDANTVIRVNLPVMGSKVDLPGLLSHLPIKSRIGQVLKDPASAGIDLHQDVYITMSGTDPDSATYTCIIFHLADSGQLASFIRTNYPNVQFFRTPGQAPAAGEYLTRHDQSAADSAWGVEQGIGYAWNGRLAVLTVMHITKADRTITDRADWYIRKAVRQSQAVLQGYPGSSFTTNQTIIPGFSDDADLTMWSTGSNNFMAMSKMMTHLPGNYGKAAAAPQHHSISITHVRFENGRLLMTSTAILPADTAAVMQKLVSRPFNENLAARLPQGSLLGMAAMHLDPSVMLPFVKKNQPLLDSILHNKTPDVARLINAFKGDFLLAAIAPQGDTGANAKPNFYFITTINDRSAFLDVAHQAHLIRDSAAGTMPDTGRSILGKLQTAYTIHDSICVFSRSRDLTDAYFTTTPHTPGLLSDDFRNNYFTVVVDIKALLAFLQSASAGNNNNQRSAKAQQMKAVLGQFDRFTVTLGLRHGNEMTSSFEIKLADPSVNSLKMLSGFIMH
jgi:hypothetical protein